MLEGDVLVFEVVGLVFDVVAVLVLELDVVDFELALDEIPVDDSAKFN